MSILRSVLATIVVASIAQAIPAQPAVTVGTQAPPFRLSGDAGALAQPGTATLIAFLDFSGPTTDAALSKSQADVVRAISDAHGDSLRSVFVDVAPTVHGRVAPVAQLESRMREWGLERFPVVQDHESAGLARRYDVSRTPCVFLVDSDGVVRGRWDRFVDVGEVGDSVASVRSMPAAPVRTPAQGKAQ